MEDPLAEAAGDTGEEMAHLRDVWGEVGPYLVARPSIQAASLPTPPGAVNDLLAPSTRTIEPGQPLLLQKLAPERPAQPADVLAEVESPAAQLPPGRALLRYHHGLARRHRQGRLPAAGLHACQLPP